MSPKNPLERLLFTAPLLHWQRVPLLKYELIINSWFWLIASTPTHKSNRKFNSKDYFENIQILQVFIVSSFHSVSDDVHKIELKQNRNSLVFVSYFWIREGRVKRRGWTMQTRDRQKAYFPFSCKFFFLSLSDWTETISTNQTCFYSKWYSIWENVKTSKYVPFEVIWFAESTTTTNGSQKGNVLRTFNVCMRSLHLACSPMGKHRRMTSIIQSN